MTDCEKWFADALAERGADLSEAGEVRRAALRASLERAVVWRRRRRRGLRAGALALAALVGAGLWWRASGLGDAPSPPATAPARWQQLEVQVIGDDAAILARCLARPGLPPPQTYLSDDELLAMLAAAGRRSGLIRAGDRLILTGGVAEGAE